MEKLIINRSQQIAFLELKELIYLEGYKPLNYFLRHRNTWFSILEPIKDLSEDEFMRLWCGWYELENPIKVNDWVYDSVIDKYRKVVENDTSVDIRYLDIIIAEEEIEDFTRVEETWKIALLELGRETPEFKIGDKYDTNMPCTVNDERGIELINKAFEEGRVKKFYPVESSIEF